jgi:uncharacterized protein YbjT (DUF2867 family)
VRQRPLVLPAHVRMAPADSDDFAQFILECVAGVRLGERQDFAGPQTLSMIELMEQYMAVMGIQRRIRRAPLPKRLQAAITAGNTSTDARLGTTTWEQWLQRPRAVGDLDIGFAA